MILPPQRRGEVRRVALRSASFRIRVEDDQANFQRGNNTPVIRSWKARGDCLKRMQANPGSRIITFAIPQLRR